MKNQVLFSSKDKGKKLKCRLLHFLFGILRIKSYSLFSTETTEECLRLAGWGQCAFYDCLERRFPCGEDGYTQRLSKHFCGKIDRAFNNFDTFVSGYIVVKILHGLYKIA